MKPGPWFSIGPGLRARVVHPPTTSELIEEWNRRTRTRSMTHREYEIARDKR